MFDGIEKLKPVRAPHILARQIWNNQIQQYSRNCAGGLTRYNQEIGRYFKNAIELQAGYSFVGWFTPSMAQIPSFALIPRTAKHCLFVFQSGIANPFTTSGALDANELTQLVGYLTTQTVAEYCTENGFQIVAEAFNTNNNPRTSTFAYCTYCNDAGVIVNDYEKFQNYVIPKITWYYGDVADRKTTNGVNVFAIYSSNTVIFSRAQIEPAGALGNIVTYRDGVEQFDEQGYMLYAIPYVDATGKYNICKQSGITAGVLRYDWGTENVSTRRIYLDVDDTAPFHRLYCYKSGVGAYPKNFVFPLENSLNHIGTAGVSTQINQIIPAYKSVDDIIKLFADFGVTVSTDINDAINPPETPDGVVNPDNPADPIDSYPDNTSDETPIDPAYITPSSFGQSRVYTPVSIRSVLSWVCDNTVDISNWKRLFANPADVIQGINIFNLDIVSHDNSHALFSNTTNILGVQTDIANYVIQLGYNNIINGGSLYLQAYYGNYADFTSMTYQAFIPFVGYISLRPSDVVNKTLQLYYAVDFATGSAIAFLNSDNKLIYSSACTVCGTIPISVSDKNNQLINNTLSGINGIAAIVGGVAGGRPDKAIGGGIGALSSMQLQTNYATRGNMSGGNIFKLLPAFIERTRFDLFLPSGEQQYLGSKYQSWAGAPSTQFATLRECVDNNGYIECDVVVLPSCTATEQEKNEIRALIQRGIFIN